MRTQSKTKVSTNLTLDQIIKVENPIIRNYKLSTYGYITNEERELANDEASSLLFGEPSIRFARTVLAGIYGWKKVKSWGSMVRHIFIDEFPASQRVNLN